MSIPFKVLSYGLPILLLYLGLLSIAQGRTDLAMFAGINIVGWCVGFLLGRRSR